MLLYVAMIAVGVTVSECILKTGISNARKTKYPDRVSVFCPKDFIVKLIYLFFSYPETFNIKHDSFIHTMVLVCSLCVTLQKSTHKKKPCPRLKRFPNQCFSLHCDLIHTFPIGELLANGHTMTWTHSNMSSSTGNGEILLQKKEESIYPAKGFNANGENIRGWM